MTDRKVYNATERARIASAPKRTKKTGTGSTSKKTEKKTEG